MVARFGWRAGYNAPATLAVLLLPTCIEQPDGSLSRWFFRFLQAAMTTPKPKTTAAQLIAELEALQEAGDEVRARIKATIAELDANAAEIREFTERGARDDD